MQFAATNTCSDGGDRDRPQEVGRRGTMYLTLHCHHQNDSCIQMGSDENRFNV